MVSTHSARNWYKRGIYSFVTSIMYIAVLLFVIFGVMTLAVKLGATQQAADDQTFKYNNIQMAKQRIMYCYGLTFDELALNTTCNITSGIINGYRIQMFAFRNCTNESKTWTHGDLAHYKNSNTYLVAIRSNQTGFSCPGQLEVFSS